MQYILSEEELQALRKLAQEAEVKNAVELQELCILAALHVPIERRWAPERPPAPWGCILVKKHDPGYCDDCPAKKVCPHPSKRFSK